MHSSIALSIALRDIKASTYNRLCYWVSEFIKDELHKEATEAVQLKEDYERALFVRLGFESVNTEWEQAIDGMASLELLDSSLLIVDDIVDHADRRMGKKSLHREYGIEKAVMLANMLKSTSVLSLIKAGETNHLSDGQLSAILRLSETVYNEMYIGEYLDFYYEGSPIEGFPIEKYLEVIKRTTGLHFGMAMKIGGMLGRATEQNIKSFWEIGSRAGTILQIRDDFIDYLNMEPVTHKPAFGDFKRNKKRLPLILAFKFFPEKMKRLQNTELDHAAKKELQSVVSDAKIKAECRKILDKIYSDTDDLIKSVITKSIRDNLIAFFEIARSI